MIKTPDSDRPDVRIKGNDSPTDALWCFGPEGAEITVRDADVLLAHLPLFLTGWPLKRIPADTGEIADIDVVPQNDGRIMIVRRGAGSDEQVFDDEFSAANGLSGALVAAYVAGQNDKVCFHASGVRIGNGLAVLLGNSFAGKSSVALQLAAAGYRLFADDRLAVSLDDDEAPLGRCLGRCLGLTPKVRLPLPEDCGARFQEYVEAFTEIRDDGAAYLKLWDGEAAVFLEEAPVSAFVILERTDTGPCTLSPASRPVVAKTLLSTCFSPHIDTRSLVPAMTRLAATVAGYKLTFASSREAAMVLAGAMREGEGQAPNE